MYFPAALSIGSDFWRAWALSLFFFGKSLETDMKHDKISSFQIGAWLFWCCCSYQSVYYFFLLWFDALMTFVS